MLKVSEWWGLSDGEKVRLIEVVQARNCEEPWFNKFFHVIKCSIPALDCFVQHVDNRRLRGAKRISHKRAIEELRDQGVIMSNDKEFNINNNYTADVVRLVMILFPQEFAGAFRIRKRLIGKEAA